MSKWTRPQAARAVNAFADLVAEAFGVPAPIVSFKKGDKRGDWTYLTETVEVWTEAGRAETCLDVSPRFAHLYFRFANPARAFAIGYATQRLNRHSGKWNDYATSPDDLTQFLRGVGGDFYRICEPQPDPAEVAAYRAKEAESAARFAAYV